MKAVDPPRLATLLMQWFEVPPPMTGDLAERYHHGRSGLWYWRQAVTATWLVVWRDIVIHPVLVARAVLLGAVAQWLLLAMLRTPVRTLSRSVGGGIWNWTIEHELDGLRALWFGGLGGVGGPVFLTLLLVSVVTGWLVARSHTQGRLRL